MLCYFIGSWGGWSHDQLLKIKKNEVVALHCSFLDLFELCSKVLPLWRYDVKDFSHHFSHPFLGTYEVHQFLDLGYLEGTHSGVVYKLHSNTMVPWNGKPIPSPTHTNTMVWKTHTIPHLYQYHVTHHTMSPYAIPFDLIPYHQRCLGSF